ncbi:MAG: hypothetical protein HUU04_05910 [Verrucomicrobiae bacterium]|nr:hypothetical protein [Verrucomicrobiae bacterium]
MNAALILTPSDMRPFIGGHDHSVSHLVAGRNEFEPAIRHAVDAIFRDMQLISSDEAGLVSSYLDGIEEPLHELAHYGVSLFAIRIQGALKVKEGSAIPNWTRTHFLVVPTTGYFRIEGEDTRFHRFDPECATAISNLYASIRSGKNLTVRFDAKSLREEYENDVPWCEQCCLSESLAPMRRYSMPPEARLFINAARTLLHYLDDKISDESGT